jgi:ribosomal protein S18 acetylase RimI-like enzyme
MKNKDFNGYTLSCKKRKFKINEVVRLLKLTYWAKDRDVETTRRSLRHSFPYGVFDPAGKLVGFLRVTSDKATVYYLSDVVVAEEERGKGLGLALVTYALSDPTVCRGKGMLLTSTAAGLYTKVGFYGLNDRLMVRDPLTKYSVT